MQLRSGRVIIQEDWDDIIDFATKKADNHKPDPIYVEGKVYKEGLVGNAYLVIPRKEVKNSLVADGIEKKYIVNGGKNYIFSYPYLSQSYDRNSVFMESVQNILKKHNVKSNLIKYLD